MSGKVGDNVYRASGVIAAASAGISWQAVTTGSTLTAVAGNGYAINTTSNACTVTLPTSASVGDEIIFTDYLRTWATNNLTISSSLNYQGSSTKDPIYDTNGESVHIVYLDATQGWTPTYDGAVAYETEPILYVTATGPDDAAGDTDGDYKVHKFITTKTGANGFAVSSAGNAAGSNTVEYVNVAGGGGGGHGRACGAGAGGMLTATGLSVTVQNYTITVGDGGAKSTDSNAGSDGSDTTAIGLTTTGGGGGGTPGAVPGDGGSGGGTTNDQGAGTIGEGIAGQGNDGGTGAANPSYGAGGGGGKGAVGGNGTTSAGGNGGTGLDSSITGESIGYAGGGGGGTYISGPSGSATDGGGAGGSGDNVGADGTANTGGGGGGGGHGPSSRDGGTGGKGVFIVRYKFQN